MYLWLVEHATERLTYYNYMTTYCDVLCCCCYCCWWVAHAVMVCRQTQRPPTPNAYTHTHSPTHLLSLARMRLCHLCCVYIKNIVMRMCGFAPFFRRSPIFPFSTVHAADRSVRRRRPRHWYDVKEFDRRPCQPRPLLATISLTLTLNCVTWGRCECVCVRACSWLSAWMCATPLVARVCMQLFRVSGIHATH